MRIHLEDSIIDFLISDRLIKATFSSAVTTGDVKLQFSTAREPREEVNVVYSLE